MSIPLVEDPPGGRGRELPTVLLVEDDPSLQMLIRQELADHDLAIDAVGTMFDALELLALQRGSFDAVIVDLGLPDIAGLDSLDAVLRAVSVPTIVFTGSDEPGLAATTRRLGAAGFVAKDDGVDALVAVVLDNIHGTHDFARAPASLAQAVGSAQGAPSDFAAAARATLRFLSEQLPLGMWMVTRIEGDDWIVLDAEGTGYAVTPGDVLPWQESYCRQMVAGEGPSLTADASSVPAFVTAGVNEIFEIETYVGLPLVVEGGALFGTLCGIDPRPVDADLSVLEPFLMHAARMLSTSLSIDLERDRLQRRLDLAKAASRTDSLTGLPNRRAFDLMLRVEEARSRRYGAPAAVAMVDLDGLKVINDAQGHDAGDRYLRTAASALSSVLRASDMAFRLGGDEFAVLATPCAPSETAALAGRLQRALQDADVEASVGVAVRTGNMTMHETVDQADGRMYAEKRAGPADAD